MSGNIHDRLTELHAKDIDELIEGVLGKGLDLSRRRLIKGGLGVMGMAVFGYALQTKRKSKSVVFPTSKLMGFTQIDVSEQYDTLVVPQGYSSKVLYAWGDPISDGPAFRSDGSNTAAEQAQQAGMHHDGMHFFSFQAGADEGGNSGLLVVNHEYLDVDILHPDGGFYSAEHLYTREKFHKEVNAFGLSVIEINKANGEWKVARPSEYARRITMQTAMRISGPAAGSEYLKTTADPSGLIVLGTNNNCGNGFTPWGTYLACEENFHTLFANPENGHPTLDSRQQKTLDRYNIARGRKSIYGWDTMDSRFDASLEPNESNRFGWIVEVDPFDPNSVPVKRTAMGRFRHENAVHRIGDDGRLVLYSGDDKIFEYIYKFVTTHAYNPDDAAANKDLLDEGTLYVGRFDAGGKGEWLKLEFGHNGLTEENGFVSQADVLVRTRMAADFVGATPMDRPEWLAINPKDGRVYVTLTKNTKRESAIPNGANPRNKNSMGHIVRWKEAEGDSRNSEFDWDVFVLGGDPDSSNADHQSEQYGSIFANPDGLNFDDRGLLWIQTDITSRKLNTSYYEDFGNNQMLVADPATGEVRRFLTGPIGCEITGTAFTPDMKSIMINIQHPGEFPVGATINGEAKTPANPTAASSWPDGNKYGRPRSATVVITKDDGGVIGS